jgi:hypothetical protein
MSHRYKNPPLQNLNEHDAFLKILRDNKVRSYLEIGAMFGGTLWRTAKALPVGSRVVAVDSFPYQHSQGARHDLTNCIAELRSLGYDAHFIFGDSTDKRTIKQAQAFAPFDALFIDCDHAFEFVSADWANYGPMARIVGFHDINWNSSWVSARGNTPTEKEMGVPRFWNELKQGYRHVEFRLHPSQNYYGIGVLWNDHACQS